LNTLSTASITVLSTGQPPPPPPHPPHLPPLVIAHLSTISAHNHNIKSVNPTQAVLGILGCSPSAACLPASLVIPDAANHVASGKDALAIANSLAAFDDPAAKTALASPPPINQGAISPPRWNISPAP
jgi:hypothetical protein